MRRGAAISELKATGETIAIAVKNYVDRSFANQAQYRRIFDGVVSADIKKSQAQPPGIFDDISLDDTQYQGIFDNVCIEPDKEVAIDWSF